MNLQDRQRIAAEMGVKLVPEERRNAMLWNMKKGWFAGGTCERCNRPFKAKQMRYRVVPEAWICCPTKEELAKCEEGLKRDKARAHTGRPRKRKNTA